MTSDNSKKSDYTELFVDMEFVFIKGGRFQLGDTFGDGFPDEMPVNEVTVSDFFLGRYPVTQGQWQKIMQNNPSMFKKGDRYPVEMVGWDAASAFIDKLNQATEQNYRLPTEAEWEYAARSGGQKDKWAGTNAIEELGDYAWFIDNSNNRTHPVGLKKPNNFNLYDMSGLVHEWTQDVYNQEIYAHLAKQEVVASNYVYEGQGRYRSFRAGSWKRRSEGVRCTRRMGGLPALGFGTYGFRVAKNA